MPKKQDKAFTLLEVIITMAIFILLCAAVFGLITAVLQSTSSLQDNENRRDQMTSLTAYLKRSFGQLPSQGVMVSYVRGTGEGLTNNGVILGRGADLTAIDSTVQPNGYYSMRVTRFSQAVADPDSQAVLANPLLSFQNAVQSGADTVTWTPLIHDLSQVGWRFQDPSTTQWVTAWTQQNRRPGVVELMLQQASELQPVTMDFWMPNLSTPPLLVMPSTGIPNSPPPSAPPTNLPPGAPPPGPPPSLPPNTTPPPPPPPNSKPLPLPNGGI